MPLLASFWALLGLTFGSFANACIYRIPRGKSIWRPRSACPHCGHSLPWWENVPVLSYALLRGRCSQCRSPISRRYPAVEFLTAVLFLVLFLRSTDHPALVALGATLTVFLVIVAFIDLEHQLIPDGLSIGLLAVGILLSPVNESLGDGLATRLLAAIVGALSGFGLMTIIALAGRSIWKKDALGGGDIKLMAAIGSFMGWTGVMQTLFWGSATGAVFVLILAMLHRIRRGAYIPFGPFLALSAWFAWARLLPNISAWIG